MEIKLDVQCDMICTRIEPENDLQRNAELWINEWITAILQFLLQELLFFLFFSIDSPTISAFSNWCLRLMPAKNTVNGVEDIINQPIQRDEKCEYKVHGYAVWNRLLLYYYHRNRNEHFCSMRCALWKINNIKSSLIMRHYFAFNVQP